MSWLDNFPYTNFHELNLDWLLTKMRELVANWDAYKTEMNLKYDTLAEEMEALKEYVDTYFDNLDVDGIIREQLQELIDDGTIVNMVLSLMATNYLPIADETNYGSLILETRSLQGFDAFEFNANKYMFVCATDSNDTAEYRLINLDTNVIEKDITGVADCHANDCTYNADDMHVYVAGFSDTNIYKFHLPDLALADTIDMSQYGQVNGIAYNYKNHKYYINFRGSNENSFVYVFNDDFTLDKKLTLSMGSFAKQGLYVDAENSRLYIVKFRTDSSFRFPPGNRINAYTLTGDYLATTYVNSIYELEGITKVDGRFVFGFYNNDNGVRSGIFRIGTLQRDEYIMSNYAKTLLSQNSYMGQRNNVYVNMNHQYFLETGGEDAPFKSWDCLRASLCSNYTGEVIINLLSDMPYLQICDHTKSIWVKCGEYNVAGMLFRRCHVLTIEGGNIDGFDAQNCINVHVFNSILKGAVVTKTTSIVQYNGCDFSQITASVDLADNGTARFYGNTYSKTYDCVVNGTTLRLNHETSRLEQWRFRNADCLNTDINISNTEITRLSDIMVAVHGGTTGTTRNRLTDLPAELPSGGIEYLKIPMAGRTARLALVKSENSPDLYIRTEKQTGYDTTPVVSPWTKIIG